MTVHDTRTPNAVAERTVYVRQVANADLPQDVRAQAGGRDIYAIHADTGERIALVADRRTAFIVARQNEMAPVSVH